MLTCKTCGFEFEANTENHYIARENALTGGLTSLSSEMEPTLYDAYDCPRCGSQHVVQERKRTFQGVVKEEEENA